MKVTTELRRSPTRRRSRACLLGGILLFAAGASPAKAQVTAVLTADNHYGFFHGSAGGEELTYLGRNEPGSLGEPGDYNWSLPETYVFDAPADHHLYVVAWDEDGGGPVMWVGQFNLPDGSRIVSDTVAWECLCAAGPSPRSGEVPGEADLSADIASGTFGPPRWSVPNGSEPWSLYEPEGLIPEVGEDALFIWIDDSQSEGACGDHYVIFRTVEPIGSSGPVAPKFIRGDCDGDRAVSLTDSVYLLTFLFLGGPDLPCRDAGDSDDSGDLSLSDAIIPLSYLFLGGPPPAAPGPLECGPDAAGDALPCDSSPACR